MRVTMLIFAVAALAACSDGSSTGPDEDREIRPTAVGVPAGGAATAVIGPEGGSLAAPDGGLLVTVPAGAVGVPTTFSVQPISNHAHGGLGAAYRLAPHGVEFAAPVRVTFHYDPSIIGGGGAARLRLAYQDEAGYWRMYRAAALEAGSGTLAVETTHFSDWSLVSGAQLLPSSASLRVGTTLELRVLDCWQEPEEVGGDVFVPIGYDCAEGLYQVSARNWAVNGSAGGSVAAGTVAAGAAGSGTATYTAPAQVPAANPVAISVEYDGGDPTDPESSGILVANITITDPAGSCAGLRDVARWNATLGLSYSFAGTNGDQEQLSLTHWAEVTAHLEKVLDTPNGVSWIGPLEGLTELDDSYIDGDDVETLAGSGPPVSDPPLGDEVHAYLNVDLVNCRYNVGMTPAVAATRTETGSAPQQLDALIGSVRSDWRPIGGGSDLTGGADFPAHSVIWGAQNSGDAYFPDGLGIHLFFSGFATEATAGTARIEWSYQPEGG